MTKRNRKERGDKEMETRYGDLIVEALFSGVKVLTKTEIILPCILVYSLFINSKNTRLQG